MGDYTAQALVTALVHAHFPSDAIVGEEDSAELTSNAANDGVRAHIVRLANDAVLKETLSVERDEQLWAGIKEQTGGKEHDERHWLELIDRGTSQGGPSGRTLLFLPCPPPTRADDDDVRQATGRLTRSTAPRASCVAGSTPSASAC